MHCEDGLICFEYHASVHFEVFVQVNPSAVGARFVLKSIDKDPLLRIGDEGDGGLALGK